jgi:hypothetical protein
MRRCFIRVDRDGEEGRVGKIDLSFATTNPKRPGSDSRPLCVFVVVVAVCRVMVQAVVTADFDESRATSSPKLGD